MTTNDSEMSEQDDCKAATPEELCEGALRHYDEISTKACHWMNTIPQAIRFWYLERPKLLASLEQKAVPQDVSSSIGSSTRNQAERPAGTAPQADAGGPDELALAERMRERARIRRQIPSRKSAQNGEPDRIANTLDAGAATIERLYAEAERLRGENAGLHGVMKFLVDTVHKAMEKYRGK